MAESNHTNTNVQFERRDVNVRAMAWIGAAIVVTAVVLHVALYWLYGAFGIGAVESGRVPKTHEQIDQPTSRQPKLQVDPTTEINQFRDEENKKLSTYGWVNKDNGIVRIPIDQAIKLVANGRLVSTDAAKPVDPGTPADPQKVMKAK
jgi:hypothetical protein